VAVLFLLADRVDAQLLDVAANPTLLRSFSSIQVSLIFLTYMQPKRQTSRQQCRSSMFDHIDFAVVDFPRSRAFYAQTLAVLGIVPLLDIKHDDGCEGTGFGIDGSPRFWIGKGAPVAGRFHLAFEASSRSGVDAFHAAALTAGGQDHGQPGLRPQYGDHYYAAFVLDPDGHVIEAVCRRAEA
jgi:catechol 2,3-dioxygenase-like lactoylglutathione lyase family enzyme